MNTKLILLSALALAMPATAQMPSAAVTATGQDASIDTAARMSLALELVKLTYPAERAKLASLSSYEANFRKTFLADPQNVAVAARYPGLVDAMATAGRDELSKITDEMEPQIFGSIAAGFADAMSLKDLRETMEFYRSDAGVALASLDPATMDSSGMVSMASLSLDHRRAIGRYQQSVSGQSARIATAQAFARVPTVVAQIFPPHQPRLNARITAAGDAFVTAKRPKK